MKNLKVTDSSETDSECILYFELDDSSYELRKIELVNGALLGFAGADINFNGTELSQSQLFSLEEINDMAGMKAIEIDEAEFEDIWQQVLSAADI